MVSLISTIINAILNFIIHILKAVFSMLSWFLKGLWKVVRLLFCALPLTTIAFVLLFFANLYMIFNGVPDIAYINRYKDILEKDAQISVKLFNDLKIWWTLNIYPYRGSPVFVLLIVLSALMVIPVGCVFLSISTVLSFGQLLFYVAAADIVIYLLRAIFHKSFVAQFMDRFYSVFPKQGKRHYEKNYERWLRKHHGEFEDDEEDEYHSHRSPSDEFYEDDDYDEEYDDEYEDDYEDEEEYELGDFYEDDDDEDEDEDFYEDDEEDYEYYEDNKASSFNFFAGCSSRESVDKKYKSLVKLYHPDNMDGDTEAIQEINVQYTEAKKRFAE